MGTLWFCKLQQTIRRKKWGIKKSYQQVQGGGDRWCVWVGVRGGVWWGWRWGLSRGFQMMVRIGMEVVVGGKIWKKDFAMWGKIRIFAFLKLALKY